ncbi:MULTISPECIES: 2-oxo-hept-4-ene-1,7-dioate hydratase [unclassified Sphingomonas]|uniref:2-oxo-hept-4-ene-1,7-dioate hydratase n=1 Tax=unclassified Sphingomonas TaxID=196159 RepID=UPI0006F2FAD2|nr:MULTISPECIES: 2-oxo-hepta-3-ene-1,7-dioic acid hydratase [unclassified Sphingomonas]KQX23600.1 2-oxo-hepta-3-ene-1,7-dioate hydratase [Sphingomonas sp. Root1294]KQY68447.1 2-oxo-hepta-3-ene-1,7-dioate hydratase [Sphingomonas sp. Root50]KRB91404.1 2-oxo-hepta-3-ene-1,7-dioate hydratase [Sphingomonas sp. Root720]
MSLSPSLIETLASRLHEAEKSRTQIGQFSLAHPEMTIEDAYAIQHAWIRQKIDGGRRSIGHKIGLTSRAMQRAVNITEPDYGVLLDDMLFHDGQTIPIERFIEPRIEVELAFILREALEGPGCTIFDVLNATDYVVPAVEIIDARIQRIDPETGTTRNVLDTISDNAADAGIVLGGRPVRPDAIDLRWVSAVLYQNGAIEDSGVAAAVLNHPANGPAWLANRLARFDVKLAAGEIILGGSFTAPLFVKPGDSFHVDYGPLGSIGMRFA